MATFGSFDPVSELYSGPSYTVYLARKLDDPETEYAVKVFDLVPTIEPDTQDDLAPLIGGIEESVSRRVAKQKQAAEQCEFLAPVLESGFDERGVWYATGYYPLSVNKLITGKVALGGDEIRSIIVSVAKAAYAFKSIAGRTHGDIQPSSIQLKRLKEKSKAGSRFEVKVSDPLADNANDPAQAAQFEISDLHALGRVLLQLVLQKEIKDDEFETLILPILSSPEWANAFGKGQSDNWLARCNRLLDRDLTLERFSLESLLDELDPAWRKQAKVERRVERPVERPEKARPQPQPEPEQAPAEPAKQPGAPSKWPRIAAIAAGVAVLVAGIWFGSHALMNSRHARTEEQFQTLMKEAKDAIDATKLDVARAKLNEAVKLKPGNSEAQALESEIGKVADREYSKAMSAGKAALAARNYQEAKNQAGIALRFKENDSEAKDLMSKAGNAVAESSAKEKATADCKTARDAAQAAEADGKWSDALTQWKTASERCLAAGEDHPEIESGIKFATAMTDAYTTLRDVQNRTNSAPGEALSLSDAALKKLPPADLWKKNDSRSKGVDKLKSEVALARASAKGRQEWDAQHKDCLDARTAAQLAEKTEDWAGVQALWKTAAMKCPGEKEAVDGATFAGTMANAMTNLSLAREDPDWDERKAQSASSLCDLTIKALESIKELAKAGTTRETQWKALMERVGSAQRAAEARIAGFKVAGKCNQAKQTAQAAEISGNWSEAQKRWEAAKEACGGNDPVALNGIEFAADIAKLQDKLAGIQPKVQGAAADAQDAADMAASLLTQLPAQNLWSGSQPRSVAVNKLGSDLKTVQTNATQRISFLKCEALKSTARGAESSSTWPEIAKLWQNASALCRQDKEVQDSISFANGLVTAQSTFDSAAKTATNSLDAARKAGNDCASALASLKSLPGGDANSTRSAAAKNLRESLQGVWETSDQFIAGTLRRSCDYSNALSYCQNHSGSPAFAQLAKEIRDEQAANEGARSGLQNGDYSYLNSAGGYSNNPCFTSFFAAGAIESKALNNLVVLSNAGNWNGLLADFQKLPADASGKQPFLSLQAWAQAQKQAQAAREQQLAMAQRQQKDDELLQLCDKWNVKRPKTVVSKAPSVEMEYFPAPDADMSEGQKQVARLRDYFTKSTTLKAEEIKDRTKLLDSVSGKIENWNNR